MVSRPMSRGPGGSPVWLAPALAALLAGVAYAPLLSPGVGGVAGLEEMLFLPGALPAPLTVGVAGFLLFRRRARLRALPPATAGLPAAAFGALGAVLLAWARLTGTPSLLLPSLAAAGLGAAAATRGTAGCRVALLPAVVLVLGVGLPKPLADEVLWQLQRGTAAGAGWLLSGLGREIFQSGVILRDAKHSFHVIDGCSGLSGIAILTFVGILVRDLFRDGGRRVWAVVALALPLGFALNVLRVAYVAASPDPAALAGIEGDHTPQGIAVLMAGTALLYAAGLALASSRAGAAPADGAPSSGSGAAPWRAVAVGCAFLALLSLAVPRLPEAADAGVAEHGIPLQREAWRGANAPLEAVFTGALAGGVHRRYEMPAIPRRNAPPNRAPEIVDLLVGYADPGTEGTFRLLSSKLAHPGPEWNVLERRDERILLLDLEVELAIAARGEERAVVYAWRPRDRGLWRESWRAWLALESSPLRRARPRAAVRLVAYAPHGGQLALDRARQRLDLFVRDFRDVLADL